MVQYFRTPDTGDPSTVHQHFPAVNITLLCCHYWWLKAWRHACLSFPYWRLYWNPVSGGYVGLNGHEYQLDPDHLVLIPPNTPFSTRLFTDDKTAAAGCPDHLHGGPINSPDAPSIGGGVISHFFVHFTAGLPYDEIGPEVFRFSLDSVSGSIIDLVLDGWGDEPEVFTQQQGVALTGLIACFLARIPETRWPHVPADPRIRAAVSVIESDLARQHPNRKLAEMVGMSTNAFARLFKNCTGASPQAYLLDRRIRRACVLLHHSSKTLDSIADDCGFCNRYYFSRMFKREIKIPPAAYRELRQTRLDG